MSIPVSCPYFPDFLSGCAVRKKWFQQKYGPGYIILTKVIYLRVFYLIPNYEK